MKRLTIAAVLAMLLTSCNVLTITAPRNGAIVPDQSTMVVTGVTPRGATDGTISVNGVAGTIDAEGNYSATIPTGSTGEVVPITAVYTEPDGTVHTVNSAVISGPSIAVGDFDLDGVALKFTNHGLDGLGPVINDLAGSAFDISAMLMAQNPIVNTSMLGLSITGDAYEAGMGNVSISAQSTAQGVRTPIQITDMYIGVMLRIAGSPCMLELQIPSISIDARFDLEPMAASPELVDVNMIGEPVVTIPTVNHQFISGICDNDTPVIGPIVSAIAGGQIQGMIGDSFGAQLGDPDGPGPADSPIADAIETALAEISIAGSVGDAVQANLDAPFTSITEQADGIHMQADASFRSVIGDGPGQCAFHPLAPQLESTFAVPGPAPVMGELTPSGQPYGLGLGIQASSFNQLLGAMTECGRINQQITEIDIGLGPMALNAQLLSVLVPEFAALDPATPMMIRAIPTVAPHLTGDAGPNGEPSELMLANLQLQFVDQVDWKVWLTLGVDAPLGFDLAYDDVAGALAPILSPPTEEHVSARVHTNAIGANPGQVLPLFETLFPSFVADIGGSFAAFPLPAFMGLELEVLEVENQGSSYVLYANLNPGSEPKIANVTINDNSTGDFATDSVFDAYEWRHRIRRSSGDSAITVDYKAMLGADACCFTGSRSADATARYTMNFQVQAEPGEAWRLDLSQAINGAHTLQEEDLGGANSAIRNNGVIAARGRVGGASWTNFNVTIPAGQREVASNNGANVPFSGSNTAVLTGTGTQNVSVEVEFILHVHSASTFFPPRAGDEAAIRLGLQDSLANNFTAGEYPGMYPRDIAGDGHKVQVTISSL